MSKHTPGPWSADIVWPVPETIVHAYCNGKPYSLAEVHSMPEPGEREANAKLIAAAPELLESCKALLEELRLIREKDGPFVYDTTCRIEARAVIAKATGEA
jgi:hypothetical protein